MSERPEDSLLQEKLETIRDRLMRDPTKEELEDMTLHLDVLEKWDRLTMMMKEEHHHDHMDDHDHSG